MVCITLNNVTLQFFCLTSWLTPAGTKTSTSQQILKRFFTVFPSSNCSSLQIDDKKTVDEDAATPQQDWNNQKTLSLFTSTDSSFQQKTLLQKDFFQLQWENHKTPKTLDKHFRDMLRFSTVLADSHMTSYHSQSQDFCNSHN